MAPPIPGSTRQNLAEKWTITVTLLLLVLGSVMGVTASSHAVMLSERASGISGGTGEAWAPPVAGATPSSVLREFSAPSAPWAPGHRGIDLEASSEVLSPEAGIVRFVGTVVDRPVLTIEHPNGMLSSFEPVSTELAVGDAVQRGQVVGQISEEQHCAVQCVHWGVRIPDGWSIGATVRDRYIDPGLLLGWSGPSVLWPLRGTPLG
ncbi:MAG: M23 family metallopeptidase [Micrococcaceae bacterium]